MNSSIAHNGEAVYNMLKRPIIFGTTKKLFYQKALKTVYLKAIENRLFAGIKNSKPIMATIAKHLVAN